MHLPSTSHGTKAPKLHSLSLKNDRYRKARGGMAAFLTLYCTKCNAWLLLYQKDGSGQLHRCYLNRIFAPSGLEQLQYDSHIREARDLTSLICDSCGSIVGHPMRHGDGRLAFRLIPGTFRKRKGVKPPSETAPD